jgi:hypothetical protein
MRVWAAHGVFVGILLASLVTQQRATDVRYDDEDLLEPSILRIASSHRLTLLQYRAMGGMMPRALIFAAPGCPQPVQVNPLLSTFEELSLMDKDPEQGYTRRYVYFDLSWGRPTPWAAFVQRMKYRALAMFGLTEYVPSKYLLRVEAPKNCEAAQDIDWSSVWSRKYLAAAPDAVRSNPERTMQ